MQVEAPKEDETPDAAAPVDSVEEVQRKNLLGACQSAEEWLSAVNTQADVSASEVELKVSSLHSAFLPVWATVQKAGGNLAPTTSKPEDSEAAPADALQIEMNTSA